MAALFMSQAACAPSLVLSRPSSAVKSSGTPALSISGNGGVQGSRNFEEGRSGWDRRNLRERGSQGTCTSLEQETKERGTEMFQTSKDNVGARSYERGENGDSGEKRDAGKELAGHVDVITSVGNAYVKHLVKVRQRTSYRNAAGCVVVVGSVPLREICEDIPREGSKGCRPIKVLLVVEDAVVPSDLGAWTERTVFVSEPVMRKVAGVDSTQGLQCVGVLALPSSFCNLEANGDQPCNWVSSPRRLLVLDGIQDPGNLGTLLRTAAAFAWVRVARPVTADGVCLLPGCCDPFNEKALRASRGATFRLPIATGHWTQLQSYAQSHQMKLYAADPDQESINTKKSQKLVESDKLELVVESKGNKSGNCIEKYTMQKESTDVKTIATVTTNLVKAAHSSDELGFLNVTKDNKVETPGFGDKNMQKAGEENEVIADWGEDSITIAAEEEALCLVLGSEGQGLSEIVRRTCVPLSIHMPGMFESLNVAVAGGIFLYLLKR